VPEKADGIFTDIENARAWAIQGTALDVNVRRNWPLGTSGSHCLDRRNWRWLPRFYKGAFLVSHPNERIT
jgi:hypothetical protein